MSSILTHVRIREYEIAFVSKLLSDVVNATPTPPGFVQAHTNAVKLQSNRARDTHICCLFFFFLTPKGLLLHADIHR